MKKAIRRIIKQVFILIMVVFALYLLISNIGLIRDLASQEKIKVAIDADPANTPGDIAAILRILEWKDIELKGLYSAQWRLADLDNDSTVGLNTEINKEILRYYGLGPTPSPAGSVLPL
jgi:hypothetical protein